MRPSLRRGPLREKVVLGYRRSRNLSPVSFKNSVSTMRESRLAEGEDNGAQTEKKSGQ